VVAICAPHTRPRLPQRPTTTTTQLVRDTRRRRYGVELADLKAALSDPKRVAQAAEEKLKAAVHEAEERLRGAPAVCVCVCLCLSCSKGGG
jgi:hypothetical protein